MHDEKKDLDNTSINDISSDVHEENIHALEENPENQLINLATSWSALSRNERKDKFSSLPRTEAEELFLSLNTHDQAELIAEIGSLEKRSWIRLLAPDDIADLIQELDADCRDEILNLVDPQTRREVIALLAYAEDNAGGLMSSRYARLRPEMTVDEAISYLRIQAKTQIETIYYAYVLDSSQELLGVVSFRELFAANPNKMVREIMKDDVIKIPVNLDQEQIGRIFSQQNLMALPVIDDDGKMKGIVTFDDIATAIQEEATEDIQKLGAVESLDAPYLKISLLELIRKRAGWLGILFVGEMFTATAMGFFQTEIEKAVVLALFIPLIISSGGNSGSQATTLIIRAIALGEVRLKDWFRVLRRELITGFSLGAFLGLIGALRIFVWPNRERDYGPHYMSIAITVAISIVGVVMWGSICGSMLPFLLKKLKLDPATASAPAVATIVDVTGLIIYFTVASLVLKGILL
jgi:magnesium transporter